MKVCFVWQSSVAVKVDRETGNAGSVLTVAGFDVQVSCRSCVNNMHNKN